MIGKVGEFGEAAAIAWYMGRHLTYREVPLRCFPVLASNICSKLKRQERCAPHLHVLPIRSMDRPRTHARVGNKKTEMELSGPLLLLSHPSMSAEGVWRTYESNTQQSAHQTSASLNALSLTCLFATTTRRPKGVLKGRIFFPSGRCH